MPLLLSRARRSLQSHVRSLLTVEVQVAPKTQPETPRSRPYLLASRDAPAEQRWSERQRKREIQQLQFANCRATFTQVDVVVRESEVWPA